MVEDDAPQSVGLGGIAVLRTASSCAAVAIRNPIYCPVARELV
jgi:hypothetical protein